jgi:hypothetical protein
VAERKKKKNLPELTLARGFMGIPGKKLRLKFLAFSCFLAQSGDRLRA